MLIAAGAIVVAITASDIFLTVLNYDGESFLTSRLNRWAWTATRSIAVRLPPAIRDPILRLTPPLLLAASAATWAALFILGFALVYLQGIRDGAYALSEALQPNFGSALYLSGITISTLGSVDITPTSPGYQISTVLESIAGLGIVTLTVSYVVSMFGALGRLGQITGLLGHHPEEQADVLARLAPHFSEDRPRDLSSWLLSLHSAVHEYYQGLLRYPAAYYFHSRDLYGSLPFAFRGVGEVVEALRWGLPQHHPTTRIPWLPVLADQYERFTDWVCDEFSLGPLPDPPEPLDREDFERGDDEWAREFHRIADVMEGMAAPSDRGDRYERYRQWLPFGARRMAFVRIGAEDLGYLARHDAVRAIAPHMSAP